LVVLAETTRATPNGGSAAPVWGDVVQLGGLGDRLGTGLVDLAGQPAPEVGLDARNHGLLAVRVGRVIGSTELALSNLC
jgi:hypothetical protein